MSGSKVQSTLTAEDRFEILTVLSKALQHADKHQWDEIAKFFTNPTHLDYSELLGQEPVTTDPAIIVKKWEAELGGLEASLHQLTDHVIEPDADGARVKANLLATHKFSVPDGDSFFKVAGVYDYRLKRTEDGWRISSQAISVHYTEGNPEVMSLSAASYAARH